jgi:murein DD-endopeptidase MepM/ murein hydrolase activator NlpD
MIQTYIAWATTLFLSLSLVNYGTPWNTESNPGTPIAVHWSKEIEESAWSIQATSSPAKSNDWALSNGQSDSHRETPWPLSNFFLDGCRVTQWEDWHSSKEWGHSYAVDVACTPWVPFDVKSPNYKPYYVLAYIGEDKRLWNYVVLRHGDERWIFGHTKASRGIWEKILPNETIGKTDESGHTTWIHVHLEYWHKYINRSLVWEKENNAYSRNLCDQREWKFCDVYNDSKVASIPQKKNQVLAKSTGKEKYYFTHYDLGVVGQNDSSPCHGASGADLCFLAREGVNTMALTVDIRNKLGVKWWDKVILEWDAWCRWIYEVHDEMNPRYRVVNGWVKRPWTNYYIKGDLPGKPGGACTVQKIKY